MIVRMYISKTFFQPLINSKISPRLTFAQTGLCFDLVKQKETVTRVIFPKMGHIKQVIHGPYRSHEKQF